MVDKRLGTESNLLSLFRRHPHPPPVPPFTMLSPFVQNTSTSVMETFKVILTFESVKEILWYDHSSETSSAVLLCGTTIFKYFTK